MKVQEQTDFDRIAGAIGFIKNNFIEQPSLEEIAEHINMSPFHFQKMFTEWAGVSPKKFLQYITVSHAKKMLRHQQETLSAAAFNSGLSGTGRLHDLFIKIEAMTPGEYKNGGENLEINYSFADTHFGKILIASTHKGICNIVFADDETLALVKLKAEYPHAEFKATIPETYSQVLRFFCEGMINNDSLRLHLKGTAFQLKVWETLLTIPKGQLASYGNIASRINNPNASRAVGSAIGDNPVAYFIPCHRIIRSTGIFGGYMWGIERKTAMIGWEGVKNADQ